MVKLLFMVQELFFGHAEVAKGAEHKFLAGVAMNQDFCWRANKRATFLTAFDVVLGVMI